MPRSATDATRFTSTTPQASTKPSSSSSIPTFNSTQQRNRGPAGETAQEKVKRLRAAANAARDAQVTGWDKVVIRGRVWADRAHRFTALSLIGLTAIAGGVTAFALGDMMIHNRSKRAEWLAEQKAKHEAAVFNARMAIDSGTASEAEVEFIAREEAEDARVKDYLEKKAAKKGVFGTIKGWVFFGLKKEVDGAVDGEAILRDAGPNSQHGFGEHESDVVKSIEKKTPAIQTSAKLAFAEEKARQKNGGPLDRLGTEDEPPKSGGWTSFMTRK